MNYYIIHTSRSEYRELRNPNPFMAQEREKFDTIKEAEKAIAYYQSIGWMKRDGYIFTLTTDGDPVLAQ